MKKNIGHIFVKVNEVGKIKKTFDLFKKKLMRATIKKTSQKNIAEKIFFIFWNELVFLGMFFCLQKLTIFLDRQQSNARARQKKNTCFFW